jgi:dihydroflavonol-4-reductase
MNKVFVTGADGMLGNSVCRELTKLNYVVKAFCLNKKCSKMLEGLGIEIVYGDVLDKDKVLQEMINCDYVIHMAAMIRLWPRKSSLMRDVNIKGTLNVMESAKLLKIKRMVHISSAIAFGYGTKLKPGNENSPFIGKKFGLDYIDSKYEAQERLLQEYKRSQFPVIIINPTFMIGPFDACPSSGKMILGLYMKSIPGYASGGKNFVCSEDVAIAIVNALVLGKIGECYIAGNENLTYKEFFSKTSKVLKMKFSIKKIPYWLILIAGAINSVMARITRKEPKLSFGMARMANIEQYYSCEKAKTELEMPSTPIEVGIQRSIDWFKQNNYMK